MVYKQAFFCEFCALSKWKAFLPNKPNFATSARSVAAVPWFLEGITHLISFERLYCYLEDKKKWRENHLYLLLTGRCNVIWPKTRLFLFLHNKLCSTDYIIAAIWGNQRPLTVWQCKACYSERRVNSYINTLHKVLICVSRKSSSF